VVGEMLALKPIAMPRPPDSVIFAARTFWLTGGVILLSVGAMHVIALTARVITFGATAYAITLGLGLLYALAGAALWFGWPIGRSLHWLCLILFLPRPALGRRLWQIGRSEEFRAHFRRAQ